MKKTLFNIRIICSFIWASALFAEQPTNSKDIEQELQINVSDNVAVTEIITNKFTHIKMLVTSSLSLTNMTREVVLERGGEREKLNVGEGFSVKDLLTATQTNTAYALIEKHHKTAHGFGSSHEKLISIQLPKENQPLDSVVISTIFNKNDLEMEQGHAWISDLKDVSDDGSRLLVEKGEPHKLSSSTTTWEYKTVILDVPAKVFTDLDWEK